MDQLQAYTALGDPGELAGLEGWDKDLEKILTSTEMVDGETMYRVQWKNTREPMWVPHSVLMAMRWQGKVEDFHKNPTP